MKEIKMFLTFAVAEILKKGKNIVNNERYEVYQDECGNRYIHGKNNEFNMYFRKSDGFTAKWGKTFDDDPAFNPFGNEIADIEITKACRGIRNKKDGKRVPCPCCYKSNSSKGTYMNFETFKKIFDTMNVSKTMTQIAFGVDAEASEKLNPDIWKIFEYAKNNNVTPNVTVADITPYTAEKIVSLCGACAVSVYRANKNCCYDSIKLLSEEIIKQGKKDFKINIHALVSSETYDFLYEVINDIKTDERLKNLYAIVFLSLKQKGRGEFFNKVSDDQFKKLVNTCFDEKITFGFDSCSANKFLYAIQDFDAEKKKILESSTESCESCMYSMYINDKGEFFPCSFMEKEGEWKNGIDMNNVSDFIDEVWNEKKVTEWRSSAIQEISCSGCNKCKFYDV